MVGDPQVALEWSGGVGFCALGADSASWSVAKNTCFEFAALGGASTAYAAKLVFDGWSLATFADRMDVYH